MPAQGPGRLPRPGALLVKSWSGEAPARDGARACGGAGDVEALVLDPCYRATPVEDAARRLGCPVEWHGGFTIGTASLLRNPEYRGPEFVRLGASLAVDGVLTARLIGDASRTGRHDEQALKRVWHSVARFGSPETRLFRGGA